MKSIVYLIYMIKVFVKLTLTHSKKLLKQFPDLMALYIISGDAYTNFK